MNRAAFRRVACAGRGWLLCAAALLAGCDGGGSGDGTAPPPSAGFELRLGGASVPALRDSSGLLRVRIERRGGFGDAIELKLANPPAGVASSAVVAEAGETEAQLPLRLSADVPLGALGIVISGSAGATAATVNLQLDVQAAQPRARELIQAALAAGQIDLGTSLLYRVYSIFGSSKLPAAYVGSGPTEDIAVFADIERERPNLPQSVLDQLQPFLVRPADPASVFNAGVPQTQRKPTQPGRLQAADPFADRCPGGRREWISKRSTLHPVRAFALCLGDAPSDSRAANELLNVIDTVDKAYGLMVANMGPAKPDLWGDDAIDFYVVPEDADAPRESGNYRVERVRGVAHTQPPYAGRTSSGYAMVSRARMAQRDYFFTVIHELFHVLQFAHNRTLAQHWFSDATASWASIHFNRAANIDPPANKGLHIERFRGFQRSPYGLLNMAGENQNEYFSYAWPLFMEQVGGAARIGGAWRALATATNDEQANDAIDGMLPFSTHFRDFAVRNLNEQYGPNDPLPRAKRYVSLDPPFPDGELLPEDGVKKKNHDIDVARRVPLSFGRPIEPLSAVYFELSVTDGTLKKVVLDLAGLQGGGLDVDALVLIDGNWEAQPRNLNGKPELTFCLDDPKEKLERIVLVVSNHQKRAASTASAEIGVTGETTPCNTVWEGQSNTVVTSPGFEATITASFVFEFDDSVPPTFYQPFRLRSGNWTYNTRSVANPLCTITSQALGPMTRQPLDPAVPTSTLASLDLFTNLSPTTTYRATGSTAIEYTQTNCRGEEEKGNTVIGWLAIDGPGAFFISDDGTTLEGSIEQSTPEQTVRHRWKLTRARR